MGRMGPFLSTERPLFRQVNVAFLHPTDHRRGPGVSGDLTGNWEGPPSRSRGSLGEVCF